MTNEKKKLCEAVFQEIKEEPYMLINKKKILLSLLITDTSDARRISIDEYYFPTILKRYAELAGKKIVSLEELMEKTIGKREVSIVDDGISNVIEKMVNELTKLVTKDENIIVLTKQTNLANEIFYQIPKDKQKNFLFVSDGLSRDFVATEPDNNYLMLTLQTEMMPRDWPKISDIIKSAEEIITEFPKEKGLILFVVKELIENNTTVEIGKKFFEHLKSHFGIGKEIENEIKHYDELKGLKDFLAYIANQGGMNPMMKKFLLGEEEQNSSSSSLKEIRNGSYILQDTIKKDLIKRAGSIDEKIIVAEKNPTAILTKEDLRRLDRTQLMQIFLKLGTIDGTKYPELDKIIKDIMNVTIDDETLKKEIDGIKGGIAVQTNNGKLDLYYISKLEKTYDLNKGTMSKDVPEELKKLGIDNIALYKPQNARRLLLPLKEIYNIDGEIKVESPWGDKQKATNESYLVLNIDSDGGLQEFYVLNSEGTLDKAGYKPVEITEEDKSKIKMFKENLEKEYEKEFGGFGDVGDK